MKNKKKCILVVGSLACVCIGTVILVSPACNFNVVRSDNYVLNLNSSNRPDAQGKIQLSSGVQRELTSSNLTTYESGWCSLDSNGYFGLTNSASNRIGDLNTIDYTISGDLQIEYGWIEFNHVDNYVATLKASEHRYTFLSPSDTSKPDIFKITNIGENKVDITSMSFTYLCTQQDPSISNAKIKIGTTSSDLVEYTPSTASLYNALGTLKFEQNDLNDGGFVLSLNNTDTSKQLYVDVSSYDENALSDFRIDVTGSNVALNNITFTGNHDITFTGDDLVIYDGQTTFNCNYINVNNHIDYQGTSNSTNLSAINITSGQLNTISTSNITIDNYKTGIYFSGSTYGKGLDQNGNLTITNATNAGIKVDYNEGDFWFNGTTNISSTQYPVQVANTTDTSKQSELFVKTGTHNWTSTGSGKTTLSVGKMTVGDSDNAPTLNITTNGGKGISDASSTGADTFHFVNGITTITDTNNGASDNYGIANYGSNVVNVEEKAKLNINNFAYGAKSNNGVTTFTVNGEVNINSATQYGLYDVSLNVGTTSSNAKCRIQVTHSRSSSSLRVACIKINVWESIKVNAGFLLCTGTSWNYTQAIYLDSDFSKDRISVASGAKLGFGNVDYGLNIGGTTYTGTFDDAIKGEYHQYAVSDNAWNSSKKITTTSKDDKATFNSIFGTSF